MASFDGSNFNVEKYSGRWYGIIRYPTIWEDDIPLINSQTDERIGTTSCDFSTAEYLIVNMDGADGADGVDDQTSEIVVINRCYRGIDPYYESRGNVYTVNEGDLFKGRLRVEFGNEEQADEIRMIQKNPNYLIHYTDYDSLSIVSNGLACENPMIWVLTRDLNPSDSILDIAIQILKALRIDFLKLRGIHSSRLRMRCASG